MVRATSSHFDAILPSPMIRESSATQHQTKRTLSGRRNSPAIFGGEQSTGQAAQPGSSDEDESPENIQRLTERLEFLRKEQEKVDKEIFEEELESKGYLAELTKERDRLKQQLEEKEEASSKLRKHGNHLDKLNRAAQSRKAAKEKQLQQKQADRQRIRDDTARWAKEIIEMKQNIEEMQKEKVNVIATKDREVTEIRKGIAEDQILIKQLEEDIRVKGVQIKAMEKDLEKMSGNGSEEPERARIERENDQAWEVRMQAMQAELGSLWQAVQQAELDRQQAEEHLAWWMSKRARNPEQFAPIPTLDFASSVQRNRSRRSRQTNSRTSTISSPSTGYQTGSMPFNNSSAISSAVSPPFPSASPFFNMSNGATIPAVTERTAMPQRDAEMLSGGGAMSPAANDLLPSNLFRDEDVTAQRFPEKTGHETISGANLDILLGHALSNSDASAHGHHTPVSASSQAASIFSSPHDSLHNLHGYQSRADAFGEGDQQAVTSTSSPFLSSVAADSNPLASSRLANLFSSTFNLQRGKPGTQEPPLLGTLKQGQSQSFPRNLEQDALDLNGSRRRRGSYGYWANPVAGLLSRNTSSPEESGLITARTGSGRRSRLNMFSPKVDGLETTPFADQALSSRPSSTYSYDQALARPSNDSQRFGWAVADTLPNRSSPLGANWSANGGPWSRAPSRRPSVQHGSTSNLSIGSTPLDPEAYPGSLSKQNSEQAPIGTRPQSSQRPVTPRLNPAAPTFKTLFGRGDAKKAAKGDKSSGKTVERLKDKTNERVEAEDNESIHESSPQNPRLSRDAQSITTATSTADSHESFDRSTSGTPSEAVTPSGPKETLMQKITRKSSSSKFNVPWSKERGLFSKRSGEPSTPGEIDEDASSEGQLGKSGDSAAGTPQQEKASRSSLFRRKSKKNDVLNENLERDGELGDVDDA